jgi:formylglycine-generating enzyme required for sulfatase activity
MVHGTHSLTCFDNGPFSEPALYRYTHPDYPLFCGGVNFFGGGPQKDLFDGVLARPTWPEFLAYVYLYGGRFDCFGGSVPDLDTPTEYRSAETQETVDLLLLRNAVREELNHGLFRDRIALGPLPERVFARVFVRRDRTAALVTLLDLRPEKDSYTLSLDLATHGLAAATAAELVRGGGGSELLPPPAVNGMVAQATVPAKAGKTAAVRLLTTAAASRRTPASGAAALPSRRTRAESVAAVAPAAPTQLAPNERIFAGDGAAQVWIPAGEFTMGADDPESADRPDERPPHRVSLSGFWMDKYEVTNARYAACVNQRLRDKPPKDRLFGPEVPILDWPESGLVRDGSTGELRVVPGREQWPVLVAWHTAQIYCESVGKRLPSEAQWEWAARGPDGRTYPWGSQWDPKRANVATPRPVPVGSYRGDLSPFGVCDLAGNVREFCLDWYQTDFYRRSPAEDPVNWRGTWEPCDRAIRGGGYALTEWDSRATSRGLLIYGGRAFCTGFRGVAAGPPPPAENRLEH